jgi:hypothetical protein
MNQHHVFGVVQKGSLKRNISNEVRARWERASQGIAVLKYAGHIVDRGNMVGGVGVTLTQVADYLPVSFKD